MQRPTVLANPHFDRTRRLALELSGIELLERHRELLARRSRRIGLQDDAAWESFLNRAEAGEPAATCQLVGLLTTSFTAFFRHPWHFDIAARHTLQAARRRGRARLWSAAAATGEEPYSLAMAMIEACRRADPPADILATDIDPEALTAAERGDFSEGSVQALETARRQQFLVPAASHRWRVAPVVRGLVEFRVVNLAGAAWPVEGPFDVIFCRNVLMYLEAGHRYSVLERMASLLAPDGLLLLDPAEHLGNAGHWFSPGAGGVYARRRGLQASRRPAAAPRRMTFAP